MSIARHCILLLYKVRTSWLSSRFLLTHLKSQIRPAPPVPRCNIPATRKQPTAPVYRESPSTPTYVSTRHGSGEMMAAERYTCTPGTVVIPVMSVGTSGTRDRQRSLDGCEMFVFLSLRGMRWLTGGHKSSTTDDLLHTRLHGMSDSSESHFETYCRIASDRGNALRSLNIRLVMILWRALSCAYISRTQKLSILHQSERSWATSE